MKTPWVVMAAAVFAVFASAAPAQASPIILGALSNFDVKNETGDSTSGFEVEIHGIDSSDVYYTYGNFRYGKPTVTPFNDGTAFGAKVLYRGSTSPIGIFEHFGVTLRRSGTKVIYNWMVPDPVNPGGLMRFGTQPPIPTPVPTIDVGTGTFSNSLVNGEEGDDAVWVKRFIRSVNRAIGLDELLSDDDLVAEAPELNGEFELVDGGGNINDDDPLEAEDIGQLFVYEIYAYTGLYDDSHTPDCDDPILCRGELIGRMMSATNLGEAGLAPSPDPVIAAVSAPGSLALVGFGLLGLAGARRRLG